MTEYIYGTDEHGGHWLTGEEIVRCRDCKFGTPSGALEYVNCLFDKENMRTFSDFCSKGIRKEA